MILHADCPGESWFLAGGLFRFKKETTTLEMLNETSDIAFKAYLTRKIQGCFLFRHLRLDPETVCYLDYDPNQSCSAGLDPP
jgi:hypothetical protein